MIDSSQIGQITFAEYNLPRLDSGEYTLTATQSIVLHEINLPGTTASISPPESHSYSSVPVTFFVRGLRFSLLPDGIHSVFPPANSAGDYTNVLPHIVLTKPVLPWQWTLTGGPQTSTASGDVTTWMALLVFDAEDPAPVPALGTLASLMNVSGWAGGTTGVASYPRLLQLDPGEAATDPVVTIDVPVDLWNQVVPSEADLGHMAHTRRTTPENKPSDPGSGQTEYAVLVANRAPHGQRTTVHLVCLEGMAKYLPGDGQSLPAGTKYIRVVSLKSWQFTATEEKVSFEGLLRKVIDKQSDPKHRGTLRLPNPEPSIEPVTNALEMGYVAFPHQTRFGASTVSWYRGPLVPFAANASNRLTKPANNADALLRYNPSTGMFDASYSAAWQLGRLLALHNKEFAVALYQWKHANQTSPPPLPDVVSNWLGRLVLLYGVPFNYLVPDERMLPPESLRFFEIDPLWMDCLMDGAYSIGRSTSTVATNDELMLDTIRQNAIDAARKQRANWLNQAGGGLVPGSRGSTISGFLLRSEVVKAYPGMDVRAFASKDVTDETNQTAILRLESISPSVLLGLFDGSIGHLAIRRAPEAMHFGLDVKGDASFYKVLRNVRSGDPSTSLPVTLRDGSKQVIQIDKLASCMAGPLGVAKVTSDIFALEMIEGAHEVFFIQS